MPNDSTMYIIGNFTYSELSVNSMNMLMGNKSIKAFMMGGWLFALPAEERKKTLDTVARDLEQGGKIFGSKIVKTLPFADWHSGLEESVKIQSDGKIVLEH